MMKITLILVCYCLLILNQRGYATQSVPECPSLDADKLAKLKELILKEDVHNKITGSAQELWGAKEFFDKDPHTCIKHTSQVVDDSTLTISVDAKGKWFGGDGHTRQSILNKTENNVYLEILPKYKGGEDFVLAKVYVLYAKHRALAYFWCLMFEPTPGKKLSFLPSVSGVIGARLNEATKSSTKESIQEAVQVIKNNKDVLGEIERFEGPC